MLISRLFFEDRSGAPCPDASTYTFSRKSLRQRHRDGHFLAFDVELFLLSAIPHAVVVAKFDTKSFRLEMLFVGCQYPAQALGPLDREPNALRVFDIEFLTQILYAVQQLAIETFFAKLVVQLGVEDNHGCAVTGGSIVPSGLDKDLDIIRLENEFVAVELNLCRSLRQQVVSQGGCIDGGERLLR